MNYLFVVGCGHTGTTLVATLLAAHSDFYVITRETRWFSDKKKYFEQEFQEELTCALQAKKSYLLEKTPKHLYGTSDIRQHFPDVKFIVTARNAKDVIWSLKNRSGDFLSSLNRWTDDHTASLELLNQPGTHLVRYEDLIEQPEETLQAICNFIGCDYQVDMLNYYQLGLEWFGVGTPYETDGKGLKNHVIRRAWQMQQPLTDRRGIWRGNLSHSELAKIETSCQTLMNQLGYNNTESWYI